MKSKTPDTFLRVRKLVRKLGELAMLLDGVSRKMHTAVEKHKTALGSLQDPCGEERKVLDRIHKKLELLESTPIEQMKLSQAQDISNKLLEAKKRSRRNANSKMTYHEYVEFTGVEEFNKFRKMPALSDEIVELEDWEKLYEELANEEQYD